MKNKDRMISGVRSQRDLLDGLLEALEPQTRINRLDIDYCEEVLKRVETTLRKLRKAKYDSGKYGGFDASTGGPLTGLFGELR